MKIRYITCSDPREHNSTKSIIDLAHLPHAEIAVQCHPSKMSSGMPRNIWFNKLITDVKQTTRVNLAMHINTEWATSICTLGVIPEIVLDWMKIEKTHNKPLIQRIQINMPKNAADTISIRRVANIIREFPHHEFIFQYNDTTKNAIARLHRTGAKFSLLFDASGGKGKSPEKWEKPVYANHPMGYSGGISVDNVIGNLDKINQVVGPDTAIWIDAEGKLKSQGLFDEKPLFDAEIAKQYVRRANVWIKSR